MDGLNYVITFSDVMSAIITCALGIITYLFKRWFDSLETNNTRIERMIDDGNKKITDRIEENDRKVNERISRLEEKTDNDISNIKEEIGDIKTDFATMFVMREDFFRAMNGVESNIRKMDDKIDKILINMGKE